MHEDLATYLDWLRGHDVAFGVAQPLLQCPDHDGALVRANDIPAPEVFRTITEVRDPKARLAADHATAMVARCLDHPRVRVADRTVWDVGCGTGVLMVAAARRGASQVFGTDVDARALALCRATLEGSGVVGRLFECSLLDAVPASVPMDLVLANLPHKPCPPGFELPIWERGGVDGTETHAAMARVLSERLGAGAQTLFFLHSLPHPRLLRRYMGAFDLELLAWKRRYLQPDEYGPLQRVFEERAGRGASLILERDGRQVLVAGAWLATRR